MLALLLVELSETANPMRKEVSKKGEKKKKHSSRRGQVGSTNINSTSSNDSTDQENPIS